MPIVGYVDPSGKDPLPDPRLTPPWLTEEELYQKLASDVPGESQWTLEMARAAISVLQDRGDMISTTALVTGCPRSEIIARKEEYVADLNDLWAAFRGTLAHRSLELAADAGNIAEVRFFTTVDGIEISGQPDLLTPTALLDYKVPAKQTSVPMSYMYHSQAEQLMVNAFICRNATRWDPEDVQLPFDPREVKPDVVEIVYIGPEKPKIIVYKESETVTTASGGTKRVRLPVIWDDAQVLEMLRPRLHLFKNALDSYPDWPEPWLDPATEREWTAEEVWGGEPTWECPGWPECKFVTCLAKRKKLVWAW